MASSLPFLQERYSDISIRDVDVAGVGEAKGDKSHWLRLETQSWYLHTLELVPASKKAQKTHICFFPAHSSRLNAVAMRVVWDKVAGSRVNHRFFSFIDYQKAE